MDGRKFIIYLFLSFFIFSFFLFFGLYSKGWFDTFISEGFKGLYS